MILSCNLKVMVIIKLKIYKIKVDTCHNTSDSIVCYYVNVHFQIHIVEVLKAYEKKYVY